MTDKNSAATATIRNPLPNDVLSGRGGLVNSHPGNRRFRDIVSTRKYDYNLAPTKAEKTQICRQVIAMVQPGRFLVRQEGVYPHGGWVQLDDVRTMAKTSQALREGAPRIRQTFRDDLEAAKKRQQGKKSTNNTTTALLQQRKSKRTRNETSSDAAATVKKQARTATATAVQPVNNHPGKVYQPAPVLSSSSQTQSLPLRRSSSRPERTMSSSSQEFSLKDMSLSFLSPRPLTSEMLNRVNSLSLSNGSSNNSNNWGDLDFVNPFEQDEDALQAFLASSPTTTAHGDDEDDEVIAAAIPIPPIPRPGLLRETSTASSHGGLAGYRALTSSSFRHHRRPSLVPSNNSNVVQHPNSTSSNTTQPPAASTGITAPKEGTDTRSTASPQQSSNQENNENEQGCIKSATTTETNVTTIKSLAENNNNDWDSSNDTLLSTTMDDFWKRYESSNHNNIIPPIPVSPEHH